MSKKVCQEIELSTKGSLILSDWATIPRRIFFNFECPQKKLIQFSKKCVILIVFLIEDSDNLGYYILIQIAETIESSEGGIEFARVLTKDGVYRKPVAKLQKFTSWQKLFLSRKRILQLVVHQQISNLKRKHNTWKRPLFGSFFIPILLPRQLLMP